MFPNPGPVSPHYSSNFSSLSSQSPPPTSTPLVLARHLAKLECHRNPNLYFKTEYKKLHQNLLSQSDPQVYSASRADEKKDQISSFQEPKNETINESESNKNIEEKSSVGETKEMIPRTPVEITKNTLEMQVSNKDELVESNLVKLVREAEPQKQVSAQEYKELLRNSKKKSIGKASAKKSILKNFGEEPKSELLTEKKEEGKKSIKKVQINEEAFDNALQEYEVQKNSSMKKESEEKMEIIDDESIPLRKTPSKKKTADTLDIAELPQKIEEPILESLPLKETQTESVQNEQGPSQKEEKSQKSQVEDLKLQSVKKSPKRSRKSERNEEKLTETPHSEKQMEILSQKDDEKEEKVAKLDSGRKSRGRKKSSVKAQKKETHHQENPKKISKSAPQKESARKSRKSKEKEEEPEEKEENKTKMSTRSRKIKAVPTPMTIMTRSKKSLA